MNSKTSITKYDTSPLKNRREMKLGDGLLGLAPGQSFMD